MNRLFRTSAAAIAVTSVGLVFAAAVPAGATTAPPRAVAVRVHANRHPGNSTSTGFAGYELTTTSVTSASTAFKVPALTGCVAGTNQGIASGVQVFNSTSGDFSAAQIFEFCNGTSAGYLADIIVNGSEADFAIAINSGDKASVSISESATKTTVKVMDLTTKASATTTASVGDTMDGATVGDGALFFGGVQGGVPNFGTITFGPSKVNNAALSTFSPTAFDMNATGSQLQIMTGALAATFKTKFIHS